MAYIFLLAETGGIQYLGCSEAACEVEHQVQNIY